MPLFIQSLLLPLSFFSGIFCLHSSIVSGVGRQMLTLWYTASKKVKTRKDESHSRRNSPLKIKSRYLLCICHTHIKNRSCCGVIRKMHSVFPDIRWLPNTLFLLIRSSLCTVDRRVHQSIALTVLVLVEDLEYRTITRSSYGSRPTDIQHSELISLNPL